MGSAGNQLRDLLSEIHEPVLEEPSFWRGTPKLAGAAVDLLKIVGYNDENIFPELSFETPTEVREEFGLEVMYYDAVAARTITSPPYVSIFTRRTSEAALRGGGSEGYHLEYSESRIFDACLLTAEAHCTVVLTNIYIAILDSEGIFHILSLAELNQEKINRIQNAIQPPDKFPAGRNTYFPAGYHPNQTKLTRWLFGDSEIAPDYRTEIDTDHYYLDVDEYSEILYDAYMSVEAKEKGDALEEVAAYLFKGLPMLSIRDRKLRTKTGEIDIVFEYEGYDELNLFEYRSRYIIVECKNTTEPTSVDQVSHFKQKLINSDIDLGILISWNGVTGEQSEKHSKRLVDMSGNNDPSIIVFTKRDLYRILDGASLYKILDEKLYAERFDL